MSNAFVPPPPPAGYACWLDYAVNTLDTRDAFNQQHWNDSHPYASRAAMRLALRGELRDLRRLAGVPDTLPPDRPDELAEAL